MLVLSRKAGESINVGDNVRLTFLKMRGGEVRVGFDAPPEVRIVRSELLERIEAGESISELRGEFDLAENRKRIGA